MAVPYTFGTATAAIPLSQLDSNFATAITLGNTAVYLGNTTTSIGNLTLTNVTISSGEVTTGNVSVSGNVTLSGGTANGVAYLNGSKVLTTGSALTFSGSALAVAGTISSNNGSANNLLSINGDGAIQSGVQFKANGAGPYTTIYFDNATNHTYYKNLASGGHLFFNNSTQAMTLDASGNLGIGTTSPSTRLHVKGSSAATSLRLEPSSSTTIYTQIRGNSGDLYLEADPGNAEGSSSMLFTVDGSERARIDSSGNLLVGTTSGVGTGSKLGVSATSIDALHIVANSAGNNNIVAYNSSGINCFIVANNGNTTNTNNSYGAISDAKLKENITDATPKLAQLNQVRVVNYNLIGDEHKQLGVIAQELEQVFPAMIDELPDRDSEGNDLGTTTKSVKYSVFVPMLIKALQEQQAIIQSLTARITALESA